MSVVHRMGAVLALLGVLVLAGCEGTTEPGPGADAALVRVGPGVAEALAEPGGARVVIALGGGPAGGGGRPEAGRRAVAGLEEVAVLTDGFLDRAGSDLRVLHRFTAVAAVTGTVTSEDALARLASDAAVARIDLDVGGTGGLGSSVAHIGAVSRHERGNDGAGVVIAVLDTGVDPDHPSLAGRVVAEACFGAGGDSGGFCANGSSRQTGAGAGRDDAGHGTHVAGIAASGGEVGAPGVAPAASLVAVKVLDDCSFSGCFYAFSEIVAALDYLITNHATLDVRVVNLSLGTDALFTGACDQTTAYNIAGAQAVSALRERGVVVVAAAMNDGSRSQMASPACLSGVVAVGATDALDQLAGFSNATNRTTVVAPGVGIESLRMGGGTLSASGTSMASPHVAGCAALLAQASPSLSPDAIIERLRTSPVQVAGVPGGHLLPRLDCSGARPAPDPETTTAIDRPTH